MESLATLSFFLWSLLAVGISFVLCCLGFGVVATFKNILSLGFLLLTKVVLALASLVCGVSLLLNIIVFVVHIVKANT